MEEKDLKEAEEMAEAAALEWTEKENTAWTDGSRLENQKVGVAGRSRGRHHKSSKKDHQ